MKRLVTAFAAAAALGALSVPLLAQAPQAPSRPEPQARPAAERRLPPDAVTQHTVELPGRTLRFSARAGSIQLPHDGAGLQAEIGFVAYALDGIEAGSRPVTFALNGGPGAASAYLHLGVLGPWRLPLDGPTISPSAAPALVPNAETWLDFTDLVFIDPVDTGYSRAVGSGDDVRNRYFTVGADVDYLSDVIARWLKDNGRLASPKFYVGESYGGFRGPMIARKLQSDVGVGLSGLVLLSPVLDFNAFAQPRHAPASFVARLPSYAAAALERKGPVTREALAEAEAYAATDYLVDLTRGLQDREAVDRVSRRVAELTGLDLALVRRYAGRITTNAFQREFDRAAGRIVSAYDTGVSAFDPEPTAHIVETQDAVLTAMTAPLTSAIIDHLGRTLNFKVAAPYHLLNGAVNGSWRWSRGRGQPESVGDLRQVMALDGKLRVLVAHGLTDLVTPYFANQLILNQLPDYGPERRISLSAYPGGHMFYSRDDSRRAFRDDALRLYRAALESRATDQTKL